MRNLNIAKLGVMALVALIVGCNRQVSFRMIFTRYSRHAA